MEHRSEPEDTSPEVTDEEEENKQPVGFVGEEVDLEEILQADEIKEEEVELEDGIFVPADDTPDPIGADSIPVDGDESETGAATDSADEAVRKDGFRRHSHRKMIKSSSSTESADEDVVNSKKRKGKPVSDVSQKKKRSNPNSDRRDSARFFVPGMMVQRNKKHLCLECGSWFDTIILFATHMQRFHLVTLKRYPHKCLYCPRKFRGKLALQRHLLVHSRLEALRCPICRVGFYSALGMASHIVSHQAKALMKGQNLKSQIYSKNVTPLDNVCFACGETEGTEDDLIVHLKAAHQGLLQCRVCYEMASSVTEFIDHVQEVHNNQAELTYYCCPLQHCARSFLSAADMRKHTESCAPPRQPGTLMDCGICGLTYSEMDHFATHMRLHGTLAREIPGKGHCTVCAVAVKSPSQHAVHMVTRHGYRDRLESLVDAYKKLEIAPQEDSSDGG